MVERTASWITALAAKLEGVGVQSRDPHLVAGFQLGDGRQIEREGCHQTLDRCGVARRAVGIGDVRGIGAQPRNLDAIGRGLRSAALGTRILAGQLPLQRHPRQRYIIAGLTRDLDHGRGQHGLVLRGCRH
jgi:hypothetical protein